jgi:hypothetical protein
MLSWLRPLAPRPFALGGRWPRQRRHHRPLPLFDENTVLVISEWEYAGKGHSAGDQLLAAALTST